MNNYLEKVETKKLVLISSLILLLVIAVLYSYLLAPKWKAYQTIKETQRVLQNSSSNHESLTQEIQREKDLVEKLKRRIHGGAMDLPEKNIESYIIGKLQTMSWKNRIELVSIKPTAWKTVKFYKELLFDVELNGDYFNLHKWLKQMSSEMGFIVIKRLENKKISASSDKVMMSVTIAYYRIIEK